jgi:hypothetical protein
MLKVKELDKLLFEVKQKIIDDQKDRILEGPIMFQPAFTNAEDYGKDFRDYDLNGMLLEEDTLLLRDDECNNLSPVDSTVLKHIGDYYYAMANIVSKVEEESDQPPIAYEKVFDDIFVNKILNSFKFKRFLEENIKKEDEY